VKPVVTGLDDPEPGRPLDHELLAAAAGIEDASAVTPLTFGPAVSPHLAAELAGVTVEPSALVAAARRSAEGADVVVGEGAGGLLAPLTGGYLIRDFALDLELPLVIAARPGLGTINHTLLTVESARGAGLDVLGVVLTPWPEEPDAMQESNRATIAALGDVEVATLPRVGVGVDELAAAGAALPLARWLRLRPPGGSGRRR
jgi:dethiobiotin synthetase